MDFLRRGTQAGIVWLTAIMTLVAGTPHFSCLCPDGHRKAFCPRTFAKASGCCCGGACCRQGGCCQAGPRPPAEATAAKSCCHHRHGAPRTAPVRVQGNGCKTTLERADVLAVQPTATQAADDGLSSELLATPSPAALAPPSLAAGPWRRCGHSSSPPPTNLVVVLQHFII